MSIIAKQTAYSIVALFGLTVLAQAQSLEIKRFNPSEWTKGRFTETVTVNGPGKTIYLAGVGAEDETAPAGASARSGTWVTPTSNANTLMTRSNVLSLLKVQP